MVAVHLTRRFFALIAGLAALVTMWTFASKPYVWEWTGRPDETYPELVFFFFGVPAAVVAVASGGWIVWATRRSAEPSWTLSIARLISSVALAICLWLSCEALSAFLNRA